MPGRSSLSLALSLAVVRTSAAFVVRELRCTADVAEQLFEHAEFAPARRRDVIVVGNDASALEAILLDARDGVAVKAHNHHRALRDAWRVERDALLHLAH